MELADVKREIEAGLTGNSKRDVALLHELGMRYRDTEHGHEILLEVGRRFFQVLPEQKRRQALQMYASDLKRREDVQALAEESLRHRDLAGAEALLLRLGARDDDVPAEGPSIVYHEFGHRLEEMYFRATGGETRQIRRPLAPRLRTLQAWASLFLLQCRFEEALTALERIKRLNPVSAYAHLQRATVLLSMGRHQEAFDEALHSHELSYTRAMLADAYRIMGGCLTRWERLDEATACLLYSLKHEDTPLARENLGRVARTTGGPIVGREWAARIGGLLEGAGIPTGPNSAWLELALDLAVSLQTCGDMEGAADAYRIVHAFVPDPELAEHIRLLEETSRQVAEPVEPAG